jgi:hypothetical protein
MASDITPKRTRYRAAALAAAGIICGGVAGYFAITGEMSGKTFALNTQSKRPLFIPVSREDAPQDFRHANNLFWAASIFSFGITAAGIWHFRDLNKL